MGVEGSRLKSAPVPDADQDIDVHDYNHPTFLSVVKKVKKRFPDIKSDDDVKKLAKLLVNPEAIKNKYFAHIVKKVESSRSDATDDANDLVKTEKFRNQGDKNATRDKLIYDRKKVLEVNVKLLWKELEQNTAVQIAAKLVCPRMNKKEFVYGPFHVALLVDDVVIEWNNSSLVVPYRKSSPQPILAANIGEPPDLCTPIDASLRNPGLLQSFLSTAREIVSTAENKLHLIDQLCGIIALYNKKHRYGTFSNNCQHFAKDVLMCLGMEEDAEIFHGKSKALADTVMAGFGHSKIFTKCTEFNSHEDLDRYVAEEGEGMGREDLEFCQLHYLLFHAWSKQCPENDDWRCNKEECRLGLVEDRIRCMPS